MDALRAQARLCITRSTYRPLLCTLHPTLLRSSLCCAARAGVPCGVVVAQAVDMRLQQAGLWDPVCVAWYI